MILNALADYYDILAEKDEVPRIGWSKEKVSYGIALDGEGNLTGIISRKHLDEKGKEMTGVEEVPAHQKRSVGISPFFLCDSAAYLLGVDPKEEKNERALKCFEASRVLHEEFLNDIEKTDTAARRVLLYFRHWTPENAYKSQKIRELFPDFAKTGFLEFTDEMGIPLYQYPGIRDLWNRRKQESSSNDNRMLCLDTGEMDIPAKLHPSIKGIHNAQSSGAALVSFNSNAYESYGSDGKQGFNAPVSSRTAFKYTAVLNKMIAERSNIVYLGSTALIFWAEKANHAAESIFARNFTDSNEITDDELRSIYENIIRFGYCDVNGNEVHYDNRFYILGLAPNAARLSIHFFWQGKFGDVIRHVRDHDKRLEIVQPFGGRALLPVWKIMQETCRISEDENGRRKRIGEPSQPLEDALMRAVITGGKYPFELLEQILDRIRTNHILGYSGWEKTAVIKAILLNNYSGKEEVATVSLNRETNDTAYVLGRLFAVLESLQEYSARPAKLNTTIKDRYFGSASATPGIVFPQLMRLAQIHERKLDAGARINYDKTITELMGKIGGESYPMRLSLSEQGIFYLGYYHQRQDMFGGNRGSAKEAEDNE